MCLNSSGWLILLTFSVGNSERILKHNAVPSRNLPIHKKTGGPSKHKIVKKDGSTSAFERLVVVQCFIL